MHSWKRHIICRVPVLIRHLNVKYRIYISLRISGFLKVTDGLLFMRNYFISTARKWQDARKCNEKHLYKDKPRMDRTVCLFISLGRKRLRRWHSRILSSSAYLCCWVSILKANLKRSSANGSWMHKVADGFFINTLILLAVIATWSENGSS